MTLTREIFSHKRLNNKKLRFFFWSELSLIESAQNGSAESLPSPKALLPQFSFLSSQSNHHISILRGALLFQNGMILLFTILKPSLASSYNAKPTFSFLATCITITFDIWDPGSRLCPLHSHFKNDLQHNFIEICHLQKCRRKRRENEKILKRLKEAKKWVKKQVLCKDKNV